jgi:hypothetical protein
MSGTLFRAPRPRAVLCALVALLMAACTTSSTAPEPDGGVVRVEVDPAFARGSGIGVSPAEVEIPVGAAVRLVALDAAGRPVNAKWSSGAGSVASVAGDGTVLALSPGTAGITATGRRTSATATVRVSAPETVLVPVPSCGELARDRTVAVASAEALERALLDARPGDVIELADGTYGGRFAAAASGTAERPIALCGSRDAVLDGGAYGAGVGFLLRGSHWLFQGFTVTRSLSGITLRGASHNVVRGVRVHAVGHEGVHFGWNSAHNVLEHSLVHDTGREVAEYGEGVYVGSFNGHWCARTGCEPDRSDHNRILDNVLGPDVRAEHVDVKEGTTGGVIRGNTFRGAGMVRSQPWVAAWVQLKGNGWLVAENRGEGSTQDGFQVLRQIEGWGNDNTFHGNTADVSAPGYGFRVGGGTSGNRVACGNTVLNAGAGFANVSCSP